MMLKAVVSVLAAVAVLPFAVAQEDAIYVPFDWNQEPVTATVLGSSSGTTTYGLIDGPRGVRTAGPATLIQSSDGAEMIYVAPTGTLSGVCNLASPVAVCTLNVQETGAPLPPGGQSTTGRINTRTTTGSRPTSSGGSDDPPSGGALGSSVGSVGYIAVGSTLALGFCGVLALLR